MYNQASDDSMSRDNNAVVHLRDFFFKSYSIYYYVFFSISRRSHFFFIYIILHYNYNVFVTHLFFTRHCLREASFKILHKSVFFLFFFYSFLLLIYKKSPYVVHTLSGRGTTYDESLISFFLNYITALYNSECVRPFGHTHFFPNFFRAANTTEYSLNSNLLN